MRTPKPPMLPTKQKDATAVISAATGLATTVIANAAADAMKVVHDAAAVAAKVVSETANKALAEFPELKQDLRDIRNAQQAETGTTVAMVKDLLQAHTMAEEAKLTSIAESLIKTGETVKAVEAHMVKQNGRLDKAETHITRQNMVIFGIAGPVSLHIIGWFGKGWINLLVNAERAGTPIGIWQTIVVASLVCLVILLGIGSVLDWKLYLKLMKPTIAPLVSP